MSIAQTICRCKGGLASIINRVLVGWGRRFCRFAGQQSGCAAFLLRAACLSLPVVRPYRGAVVDPKGGCCLRAFAAVRRWMLLRCGISWRGLLARLLAFGLKNPIVGLDVISKA